MGGDALDNIVHLHLDKHVLKDLLEEFGDDYAWLGESWTQEKENHLIENFIKKLVDISP